MEESMLLKIVGDTIENRIIDLLIEGRGIDYTKTDNSRQLRISRPTLYKKLPKLIKQGVVKPTRIIGRVQLYTLNTENEKVKALLNLEKFLLQKSFQHVEKQPCITAAIPNTRKILTNKEADELKCVSKTLRKEYGFR